MKYYIVLLSAATITLLTACGSGGGGGGDSTATGNPSPTPPVVSNPDPVAVVPPTPDPVPTPDPTPAPVPTPPPPANLTCYHPGGSTILCNGGNLADNMITLDIRAIFVANDPRFNVTPTAVSNDLYVRSSGANCPQPNTAGCYKHSACVSVDVQVIGTGTVFHEMACGDAVTSANIFEEL